MPSEADCLYLEKPPIVPPLKTFYVTSRPGRPKKGTVKPQPQVDKAAGPSFSAHELPDRVGGHVRQIIVDDR